MVDASASQDVQGLDVARHRKDHFIHLQPVALVSLFRPVTHPRFQELLFGRNVPLGLQQFNGGGGGELHDRSEGGECCLVRGERPEERGHAADTLELRTQRLQTTLLGTRLIDLLGNGVELVLAVGPVAGPDLTCFEVSGCLRERRLRQRVLTAVSSGRPQLAGARVEVVPNGPRLPTPAADSKSTWPSLSEAFKMLRPPSTSRSWSSPRICSKNSLVAPSKSGAR